MLLLRKHEDPFDRLAAQLRLAPAVTRELMTELVENARACGSSAKTAENPHIARLIEAGAWTDAALALIELELPGWRLRRLLYEDGEWHCSLSSQPNLPACVDDTANASHEILALALLNAFIEARGRAGERELRSPAPRVRPAGGIVACCDNFA
jgi:hypothetical protein